MSEVWQLAAEADGREARADGAGWSEELAAWPEEGGGWRIALHGLHAPCELTTATEGERIVAILDGSGLALRSANGENSVLRRGEARRIGRDEVLKASPVGEVLLLEVSGLRAGQASAEVLTLGKRELREIPGAGDAFLYIFGDELVARVTDEEEAFCMSPGGGLWLRELRGEEELWLQGKGPAAAIALVRIAPFSFE